MDPLLVAVQLLLGALGVLGIASSTPDAWTAQVVRVAVGLGVTYLVSRVSAKTVVKLSPYAYVAVLLLLIATLFIGISPAGSQSTRWLLFGGFTLQPSEIMKVTVIAYLTAFFYKHSSNWQIWRPMLIIGIAVGAIVAQPDISTALFIFVLAFALMLAAGTTLARLLSITTAAALVAVLVAGPYLSQFSYIGERIIGFSDLWGEQAQTQSTSYQASQARRTLVRAGLFGIGPGRPFSVPEAHTDMIAISVAHSLGFAGVAALFALYLLIAARGLKLASAIAGPGSLLAAGATAYICGQAGLNLLVAASLMPITGIPLPFVSYGMNSLLSVSAAMGFIQLAYRQARAEGVAL